MKEPNAFNVKPIFQSMFTQVKTNIKTEKAFFIVSCLSFLAVLFSHFMLFLEGSGLSYLNVNEFPVGKVADRDVIASKDVSYIDKEATEVRISARLQAVYPVFRQDADIVSDTLKNYAEFISFISELQKSEAEQAELPVSAIQEKYPGYFTPSFLERFVKLKDMEKILTAAQAIVKKTTATGIIEFPEKGIDSLNKEKISLLVSKGNSREYETTQADIFIKIDNLSAYILQEAHERIEEVNPETVLSLVRPFLKVNVLYDEKETQAQIQNAVKQAPPVLITIEKGQKIIKRGFIITQENYNQLKAYAEAGSSFDVSQLISIGLFLVCLYVLGSFIFSQGIIDTRLKESQKIFLLLVSVVIYTGMLFAAYSSLFTLPLDFVPIIPVSLVAMLVSALLSVKVAAFMVFFTSLIIVTVLDFQLEPALFALFSGLTAVSLTNLTGRRMDLIKTAVQLAAINPVIAGILVLVFPAAYTDISMLLIGSVLNGFMSGIFVLGFLPILEDRMNTATCFRLMELSDLNSPIMKQMLVTISGTYNHTMMVATLAEAACREIGANALLARVGAYYHDIGKMANGEYFVENQTTYNKHLDLNPRLSATIIRSHVKIGVETAEKMRLPREVIDIIREHHGNSLVQYFYAKAKELDPSVSPKEFSYPGQPPRTKESAVVMLADVTEAACRTLENPSFSRLEKFIGKLIKNKIEAAQLDNSDLTFRELKIIQSSFTTILAGYYHSRIKYPNQKDPDAQNQPSGGSEGAAAAVPADASSESKEMPVEVKNYLQLDLGLPSAEQVSVKEESTSE